MKSKLLSRRTRIIGTIVLTNLGALVLLSYLNSISNQKSSQVPAPVADEKPKTAVEFKVSPVVQGLSVPWSMVFTTKERWLVSERSGAIRVVQDGTLLEKPLATFDVSNQSEEGLMGLALDPDYSSNKFVYACYAYAKNDGLVDRVVRFEDRGASAGPQKTLIDDIPAALNHAGCRLGFGPADKKLYITTGDATDKTLPQNKTSLGGKILRINSDGTIPTDNPFAGSPIWSLGHRNPQGIAWQPGTNQLFAAEHGPSGGDGPGGGDEINIIQKGANYGWPIISHEKTDARFVSPLLVYTPAIAPGGAAFYGADILPQFKNNLLFAGLRGKGIYRAVFDVTDPTKIVAQEKVVGVDVGRVRDIVQGPDGFIYIMTSNRDGRGLPRPGDDKVYRISPK